MVDKMKCTYIYGMYLTVWDVSHFAKLYNINKINFK